MKKKSLVFFVLFFLMYASSSLFSQYIDVGENPDRVLIKRIESINVPVSKHETDRKFVDWSPNGEYFAFKIADKKKTLIFRKSGELLKEISGIVYLWLLDSERVVISDNARNYYIYNVMNSSSVIIGNKNVIWGICINPLSGNIVFQDNNYCIVELDVNSLNKKTLISGLKRFLHNMQIVNKNYLYYSDSEGIYRYNFNTNLSIKILTGQLIKYFILHNKKVCFFCESDSSFIILNEDGSEIFRNNILLKKGNPGGTSTIDDIYDVESSAISPNGKLIAISRGLLDSEDGTSSVVNVWIMNMNGVIKKLENQMNFFPMVIGWSPHGDKILVEDNYTKKIYMINLEISE
jgi:hypothetical protein